MQAEMDICLRSLNMLQDMVGNDYCSTGSVWARMMSLELLLLQREVLQLWSQAGSL